MKHMLTAAVVALAVFIGSAYPVEAKASPVLSEADQERVHEGAVILTSGKPLPETVFILAGKPAMLWITNHTQGRRTIVLPDKTEIILKPNQSEPAQLGELESGSVSLEVTDTKTGTAADPINLVVDQAWPEGGVESVVVVSRRLFTPVVTRVPAGRALSLKFLSTVNLPHKDFELQGTGQSLSFKRGEVTALELPEGLEPGTYLFTRPGYPKQNHGIKARVIAVEMDQE